MKNVLRCAALLLAVLLCLSFAGCYSENNTWSAKAGDDTLSIGAYIYYLNSAYSEARAQVSADTQVLKATINGKKAEEWIRDRAQEYVRSYYFINQKFDELGLTLDADDEEYIGSLSDSMWSYYREYMEGLGISEESFAKAYARYSYKYDLVMLALYGEGGEKEMDSDELKQYFADNFTSYEYFSSPLSYVDEDGNSQSYDEATLALHQDLLEQYAERINKGELSVEEAAQTFASVALEDDNANTYMGPLAASTDSMSTTIASALEGAKDGEAVVTESTTYKYLIRKLSAAEQFDDYIADEDQYIALVYGCKGDEFRDYVTEQSASVDVQFNDSALKTVSVSRFVNDSTKYGAITAESTEE